MKSLKEKISFKKVLSLFWICLLFASCNNKNTLNFEKALPKDQAKFLRTAIQSLHSEDRQKWPEYFLKDSYVDEKRLEEISKLFPKDEEAKSISLISYRKFSHNGPNQDQSVKIYLVYRYEFSERDVFIELHLQGSDDVQTIQNVNAIKKITNPNAIESKKSSYEILIYTLIVMGLLFVALIVFWAFIKCLVSNLFPKKILWSIFIWTGIFRFTFVWTTGQWAFYIYQIKIVPMDFIKTPFSYILAFNFPIGAIVFWLTYWRKKRASQKKQPQLESQEVSKQVLTGPSQQQ